jgi:hypothetical protein
MERIEGLEDSEKGIKYKRHGAENIEFPIAHTVIDMGLRFLVREIW